MPHEVIMPALGMAQQTGQLVRWLKSAGDAVRAGEPLFEVETDKAVMEVEAQADGFLSAMTVGAGQEVPVGQVIALISDQPVAASVQPAAEVAAERVAVAEAPSPVAVAPEAVTGRAAPALPAGERIFASPKARRLAREAGLDLSLLAQAGHRQPFHSDDLDLLRKLSAAPPAPVPASPPVDALHIGARVPRAGIDAFLHRMQADAGLALPLSALLSAFAAAAFRTATGHSGDLVVAVTKLDGNARGLLNPDRGRLSAQSEATGATPHLILRDLTGTCITTLRPATGAVPVLTLAEDGEVLRLALDAAATGLDEAAAIALVTGLAERLTDPLIHLV